MPRLPYAFSSVLNSHLTPQCPILECLLATVLLPLAASSGNQTQLAVAVYSNTLVVYEGHQLPQERQRTLPGSLACSEHLAVKDQRSNNNLLLNGVKCTNLTAFIHLLNNG